MRRLVTRRADVRLLLDPHVVLWELEGSRTVRPAARDAIEQAKELRFSAVSFAEVGVRAALGTLSLRATSGGALTRFWGASLSDMDGHGVSPIPGVPRWSYGAFRQDHESESITVPVVRDDGGSAELTVPKFVEDPEDLRAVAIVVIGAFEKWEAVQGLGG